MNIAVYPRAIEEQPRTFEPKDAPDLVINWEQFGRFVTAFRAKTGASRTMLSNASGVHRAEIAKAEQFMALSPVNFLRMCVFLRRAPTFFCTTLGGWQPHHPE